MPRLAVLSDVHGNLVALRAVLADADARGADGLVVAGDLTGFGPSSENVVDLLRARGARMVRGNHEKDYVAPWDTPAMPDAWRDERRRLPYRMTMERLGPERRRFLASLPDRLLLDEATLVLHGSPRDVREGMLARDSDEELSARYAGERCRLALSGHTHRPLIRELPERRLVNVGSVGLPLDGDPRASYGLIERGTDDPPGGWRVEIWRVRYDLEAALAAYDNGFRQAVPEYVALIERTLVEARDYFAPGTRATAAVPDDELLAAVQRWLREQT